MYNLGKGIQECTETSLLSAVDKLGKRNLVELDAALCADEVPIASHDLSLWRIADVPRKPIREFHSTEVVGKTVVIREVLNANVSDSYVATGDTIQTVDYLLERVFQENDGATVFLDCREFEAHIVAAQLSHRPRYHQKVVITFYTFKYASGEHLVESIEKANPATGWRTTVALMPILFPEELSRLAKGLNLSEDKEDDLFEAGKLWIDSILRQPIRVVAVEIVMAMVTCEQLGDNTESDVIRAFLADFAAVRLAAYLKNEVVVRTKPHLKLATLTRCYDFSVELENMERAEFNFDFLSGRARRRETDERRHIRRGYGIPGNAAVGADWVMSDRPEDDMAYLEWLAVGIRRQVDHCAPHLDLLSL
ncbi:agrocinopine synthase [Agrobacterium vitis]|nr:agrocinopine synthase [Agrobacterium vitis]